MQVDDSQLSQTPQCLKSLEMQATGCMALSMQKYRSPFVVNIEQSGKKKTGLLNKQTAVFNELCFRLHRYGFVT